MRYKKLFFSFLFFSLNILTLLSQDTTVAISDSANTYYIVTMKDGTVLKGQVMKQERRRIDFEDEMIGNISFRMRDVSEIERVDPQEHYLITLMNGTALQGRIVRRKEKEIVVQTAHIGNVPVDVRKIKSIKPITAANFKDGKYWFRTRVDAHYFIMPSAIPFQQGEAYYQNTMGLYNSFEVGIAGNFSCFGGIVLPTAFFIAPHYRYKLGNRIHAGTGILFADITGPSYAGAGYAQITFGNRVAHMSVGGGYGFIKAQRYFLSQRYDWFEMGLISVSGFRRFLPRYAIVSENWFSPAEGIKVFSGGLRMMNEKSSWDFGISGISVYWRNWRNISIAPLTFISYMRNF